MLVGTTVDFLNSDAVLHNVFSPDACADKFNLGTWPQGQSKSQKFEKVCVRRSSARCTRRWRPTWWPCPRPYFAVTKADGSYTIAGVPDGA